MLRFRDRVLCFRDLGVFVFEFWVLRFRDRVLRFRDLGSSFSRFGCFVLRSSFSSASFSKLPFGAPASAYISVTSASSLPCLAVQWGNLNMDISPILVF